MRHFSFAKDADGIISFTSTAWIGSIALNWVRSGCCGGELEEVPSTSLDDTDHKPCRLVFAHCHPQVKRLPWEV
jgi:hypothetical protein